jgi:hypothetical protein
VAGGEARKARIAVALLFLAAGVAAVAPLLAARYLPLLDAPNHLGAIAIWHHYDDPNLGFSRHYELNLSPVPYWGYFGAVHLLAYVLPLEWANKLFLAVVIVALPLALAVYLRAHRRPESLALVAIPLAWSNFMALGFFAFLAGVVLLLLALALLARTADARPWPEPRLVWANVAMGLLLYFFHPLPFLLWLPAVLLYLPSRVWVTLPSLAVFGLALATASGRSYGDEDIGRGLLGHWNTLERNVSRIPHFLFDFIHPTRQRLLGALLVATLIGAAFVVVRDRVTSDRRPLLYALILLAGYFVLPEHVYRPLNWWMMNGRLILVIALVAAACVPAGALPGWRPLVLAPLAIATVVYGHAIFVRFADFDRRAADFEAVVAALPEDPAVITLTYPPMWDPAVTLDVWREFPSYVQVRKGGYNPWAWDDGFPMRVRPEAVRPAPHGHHPERFDFAEHGGAYDWFLTRNEPAGAFAGRAELDLVTERGSWRLWRRRGNGSR